MAGWDFSRSVFERQKALSELRSSTLLVRAVLLFPVGHAELGLPRVDENDTGGGVGGTA